MPSLSHDAFDLHSADQVPDSYSWPSSFLHDHPVSAPDAVDSIPVIDISSPSAASLVGAACRSFGVFYATGHGVPSDLLRDVEAQARRLFSLPLHRKLLAARLPGFLSGYGRPPLSSFFPKLMWSEGFTLAGDPLDVSGNIWSHDHSLFCEVMEKYKRWMKRVAEKLLNLMLHSMGLDDEMTDRAGFMKEMILAVDALQLNSYPPCPEPEKAMGMAPHTDSGLLTVLHQNGGARGLQILRGENVSGTARWVAVPPLAGALVIHVGDLLQILSNGRFRSVRHRAVVNAAEHRISVAYIIGPPGHVKVGPIRRLIKAGQSPMYRSVTWPEYLAIRARLFDKAIQCVELPAK
ncbi:Gibberellin 3-beta-dioxygenase 1 [Platanthera guangdongensis]|uniref:Gibberellin 3-beta-dioxygenase 1 n=1 Tax=Platanthera guangdongensis TaxID=2320717 RepID=A0ABR2LZA4_9ASPA